MLKHHKLFSEDMWCFLKDKTVRDTTSECVLLQKGSLVCIFEQRICTFSTTSSTHHAKGSRTDTGNTGKYERREIMSLLGLPFHFICKSVCNMGTRKTNIWGCCSEHFWRPSSTNESKQRWTKTWKVLLQFNTPLRRENILFFCGSVVTNFLFFSLGIIVCLFGVFIWSTFVLNVL